MGKATIISGGDAGLYSVSLDYDEEYVAVLVARFEQQIEFYYDQIDSGIIDANGIARRKLWIAALRKRKAILENTTLCPGDRVVSAWCADLTEDLSGTVGTIEIESTSDAVLIRPGYEGNAVFQPLRDGQMQALLATDPAATLLNFMFHDGRQKWYPRHRLATLVSVDHDTDTCSLTLDSATGKMTGEDINIMASFSSVPIEYMSCNSPPFEAGDRVVVEFTDNEWSSPVVIGFESEPKSCDHDFVIITTNPRPWDPDGVGVYNGVDQWSIVWDVGMNAMAAEIPASATPDDFLTFPCPTDDLAYWASITDERASEASLLWDTFDDVPAAEFEAVDPGTPFYPVGGEGVVCSPALFDEWKLSDFNYQTWRQDKYKWTSQTNVAGSACAQRTINQTYRDTHPKEVGKIWPGHSTTHFQYITDNSPLGDFEEFVNQANVFGCLFYDPTPPPDYENSWNYYFYSIPTYLWPWWTVSAPERYQAAVYSKNSHVQIHVQKSNISRQYVTGGGPSVGDPWTYEYRDVSKIQIHAAASYHPSAEGEGGINANPLGLSRNSSFEDAILDLLETQLKAEDAGHSADWSYWALDADHDPTWPGPGDSTLFDAAASETYQVPLLYSLTFDIQFRETPEE